MVLQTWLRGLAIFSLLHSCGKELQPFRGMRLKLSKCCSGVKNYIMPVLALRPLGKGLLPCIRMLPGILKGSYSVRISRDRDVHPGLSGNHPGVWFFLYLFIHPQVSKLY